MDNPLPAGHRFKSGNGGGEGGGSKVESEKKILLMRLALPLTLRDK